jgi:hypothetical protein
MKRNSLVNSTLITPPPLAPPLKVRGGRGSYDSGGDKGGCETRSRLYAAEMEEETKNNPLRPLF